MKQITLNYFLFTFIFCIASQNVFSAVGIHDWRYTGDDVIPGGMIGVIDLADASYTDDDFVHMALQYYNSTAVPVTFEWSSLTIDGNGNIHPDPVTGYDANVAYISIDLSPQNFDGVTLTANEFGMNCVTVTDLTTTPPGASVNGNCKAPRNVSQGISPNVAFAVIYLNTNGASAMLPLQNQRRHLLTHEMGHVLGLEHSNTCTSLNRTSSSIMEFSSDPATCSGAFTTLQADDTSALNLIY